VTARVTRPCRASIRGAVTLGLAAGLLASCSTPQQQGPYYGDDQYLALGVNPDAEALPLRAQLEALGYPLVQQVQGRDFNALGFSEADGQPSRVRVVTARGIALALDPVEADAVHDGQRYELLRSPFEDTHDADGDGFDEIFVRSHPASGEPPCILVYRVRDSGFVDPVPGKSYALAREPEAQDDAWRDPTFCEELAEPETSGGEADEPPEPSKPEPAPSTEKTVN